MSKYAKIKVQCLTLLNNTKEGLYITEPEQLASYFDDITFPEFIQNVYNKRIAHFLQRNKANMKADLRTRWFLSNKIKAQETLYRLLANTDELTRLKGESQTIEGSGSDPLLEVLKPQEVWDNDESDPVQ